MHYNLGFFGRFKHIINSFKLSTITSLEFKFTFNLITSRNLKRYWEAKPSIAISSHLHLNTDHKSSRQLINFLLFCYWCLSSLLFFFTAIVTRLPLILVSDKPILKIVARALIKSPLILWKGCVSAFNNKHSLYCEWL